QRTGFVEQLKRLRAITFSGYRGGTMNRRLKEAAIIFIVVLAGAQLVRPDRANPATNARHTIQADAGTASGLAAVVDRSCRDCHSNGNLELLFLGGKP